MMFSLVKYNISYYIKSAKYLAPVLLYIAFLAINYQASPIGIWSNLHITIIAIFIFANFVAVSFINSEDKTQRYIAMLHVKNETVYHLSKILSLVVFLLPFYVVTVLLPIILGSFSRSIRISEIIIYLAVYFLIGFLGIVVGVFFNSDLFSTEMAVLAHIVITTIFVVPFNVIYENNVFIVFAYYLLPPVNFLAERLHRIGDGTFYIDLNFGLFVANAVIYVLVLTVLYNAAMRRFNKR